MTDEQIKTLQEAVANSEAKLLEQTEATRVALEESLKHKTSLDRNVEELIEERKKKQEAIEKLKLSNGETDINDVIEQAFKTRKEETRTADFKSALDEFKVSKPEFQSDAAGLVFGRFETGLKRFNFSDVETKEQMKTRLEEAYRFLSPKGDDKEEDSYTGSPSGGNPVPQYNAQQTLDEKTVLENTGMDAERYKALRGKYGDAFSGLGL